jgi:hypothetical protein
MASGPALSVVLPTADDFSTIRQTVRALGRQTIRDRIELVIVAPREAIDVPAGEVSMFAGVRVVNGGAVETSNKSRCAGVRAASASFVALAEDHSFPEPDWAESLLAAHAEGYAVVGPVVGNANPDTMVSWANLVLEYGPWFAGTGKREMDNLPGHNSSYDRSVLLSYGEDLEKMFEVDAVLQRDVASKGHRLTLEPKARTRHLNFSLVGATIPMRFHCGRSFAGHRIIGWSIPKRIGFALGAPLIPLVRLTRVIRMLRSSERYRWLVPRVIPMLCLAVVTDGLGEMAGYILGPGQSPRYLGLIEFNRLRAMNEPDRARYWKMAGEPA